MSRFARSHRKIVPAAERQGADAVEIGPTALAIEEWSAAGLTRPDLTAIRAYRHRRLLEQLVARDCAAFLLFDPLNIRYATDTPSMQLWNTHNPFRAVLVCADGYMVLWDYKGCEHLSAHNPLIRERRTGADLFYFDRGEGVAAAASLFAAEVVDLVRRRTGSNVRIAVDKIMIAGLRALEAAGLEVIEAEALTERARAIKSADEIGAMRCAMHTTEVAVRAMHDIAQPGLSECDVWAVLHAENIRRGGEWIETRLLSSGPRTNPWYQECGPRILRDGEILAFDTDLIGPYGMCCDISRTWWIGEAPPETRHIDAMKLALDHLRANCALLGPGVHFDELTHRSHRLPSGYQRQKYGCLMHGVGLCDEWPMIAYPDGWVPGAFDGVLKPGMVMCVESLVSEEGGDFSIKLEEQILITDTGIENLTTYPFDARLTG